ncbi:MAG: hypothetical protein IJ875_00705, partial [Solobacterium sp.]|nr:hypothetical protein [Solobacterium sp.]
NHILYIASDNDAYATLNERGNVSSVAIGRMGIALCNDDGSVALYRPDGTKVDLVDLQGVKNVCIGESFVAGIASNGEVKVYGAEASFSEAVKKMKNSMYLASDRDTLVALDRNLNIFGAGENTNKQYGEVEIEPTPSATPETKTKLASVQNIHFDQSTANVQIKWDAVENANRYAISISPALDRTIPSTASTSASVPSSSFQKDVTYTITIIAYPKDDDKYEESEASVAQFTYIPKTIQLNSPTQVQALTSVDSWNIVWDAVEHADYYMVSIDDEEPTKVTETIYEYKFPTGAFEHLSEHIVRVRAGSDNEKYEESSPTEANLIYEAPTYNLDIDFVDNGTNITINAKPYILQVGVGSYSVKQIAEELAGKNIVPEGFELVYPDNMVNIQSDTKIIIAVRVKKVEPISTNEPEPEVSPEVNEETLPNG